jgi:hypothetical protein
MVALYWLLNRLFTYWFMSDVLPTLGNEIHGGILEKVEPTNPLSPRMITYVGNE